MVAFSQTPWSRYRVRSISLPARSHPSTIRVEEELAKLRSSDPSSLSSIEPICSSLSGLVELYRRINEVLKQPLPQQALASHRGEAYVQELVDGSVRLLDICDNTRDAVLAIKESVRELQSAIRRSQYEDGGVENSIAAYACSRRRIRQEMLKKSMASLREMEHAAGSDPLEIENEVAAAVMRVLREASSVTSSMFRSVVSFLAVVAHRRPKRSRWTLVWRVVQKERAVSRNNELENLEMAMEEVQLGSKETIQWIVGERLEGLDCEIERIEGGTEALFREMIHTRVCLLNIITH